MTIDLGTLYHSPNWNRDSPRIQISTIKELLTGAEVRMPPTSQTGHVAKLCLTSFVREIVILLESTIS
jgi:hypothetical protein